MPDRIEAVVFDCDGVLVDSEMLSAGVLMGMMSEIGLPITFEIFRADFLGRSFANAAALVEKRFGRPMPDDFQLRYRDRLLKRMASELQPMPGIQDLLRCMTAPFWLATSSSPQRLDVSLTVTGLMPFFSGRTTTASEVAHGKPEPDLFLHAAGKLGVEPARCVAVEDSELGIRAAQAAGMEVWHFAGGAHIKAGYALPEDVVPSRVMANAANLKHALQALGLCNEV